MKYLMMKKIIVIDNIISKKEQENIKSKLLDNTEFPWYFIRDITNVNFNKQSRPGFKHIFQKEYKPRVNASIINLIVKNTAKKIKLKNYFLQEARSFLQLPLNEKFIGNDIDTPHLDQTNNHLVFLYYVNDSDGDTVIYNYKSKSATDIPFFEDIKELKRVTPKQGRVVIFDGMYWHTAQQPKNNIRCIINFNISNNGT